VSKREEWHPDLEAGLALTNKIKKSGSEGGGWGDKKLLKSCSNALGGLGGSLLGERNRLGKSNIVGEGTAVSGTFVP